MAAIESGVDDAREAGANLGLVVVTDCIEEEFLKLSLMVSSLVSRR